MSRAFRSRKGRRLWRRTWAPRVLPAAVVALSIAGLSAPGRSEALPFTFYKFTPIADTQSGLWEFVSFSPAISNNGRIAWQGRLSSNVEGVFARVGTGGVTTLADTGVDPYSFFGLSAAINSGGAVMFFAQSQAEPRDQVFLLGVSSATPIVSTGDGLFTSLRGFKLNDAGTAAFGARRRDGKDVIFTRNAAGTQKLITGVGGFFKSVDHHPTINNLGTVVFIGTTVDDIRGIFKLEPGASINAVTNSNTDHDGFELADLNDAGQIAWIGSKDNGVRGIFRISGSTTSTITIADSSGPLSATFGGLSINNSGRVAYAGQYDNGGRMIAAGPNVLASRIIGTGDVLFGRTVQSVFLDRDGLNDNGQLAIKITFTDLSQMIARVDPTPPVFENIVATRAVQVTTTTGGDKPQPTGAVTLSKAFTSKLESLVLSFDVRFLAPGSDLTVNVNGIPAHVVRAANFGARTRVEAQLELRNFANGKDQTYELQFAYAGDSGATAQIDRVVIRDALGETVEEDGLPDWKVDETGGGSALAVDTTRFPVKIDVQPGAGDAISAGKPVPVAILSSDVLDAPAEIDPETVRFVGSATAQEGTKPVCKAIDVDGDRVADLYCEVATGELPTGGTVTLALEAETASGLRLLGEEVVSMETVK